MSWFRHHVLYETRCHMHSMAGFNSFDGMFGAVLSYRCESPYDRPEYDEKYILHLATVTEHKPPPPVSATWNTPTLSLLQGLKELNELVSSYQGLRDNGARGPSIVSASIACARTCNLDKDIKDLPSDDTDTKLMTIEVGTWSSSSLAYCTGGRMLGCRSSCCPWRSCMIMNNAYEDFGRQTVKEADMCVKRMSLVL